MYLLLINSNIIQYLQKVMLKTKRCVFRKLIIN